MTEKKLRFRARIEGKEAGVVAAITPPIDVLEVDGVEQSPRRESQNPHPSRKKRG